MQNNFSFGAFVVKYSLMFGLDSPSCLVCFITWSVWRSLHIPSLTGLISRGLCVWKPGVDLLLSVLLRSCASWMVTDWCLEGSWGSPDTHQSLLFLRAFTITRPRWPPSLFPVLLSVFTAISLAAFETWCTSVESFCGVNSLRLRLRAELTVLLRCKQ